MRLCVRNLKLSAKIPTQSLQWIIAQCKSRSIRYKTFHNFVLLYVSDSSLRLTFFKKGEKAAKQHLNITGVSGFESLPKVLIFTANFLECQVSDISYCIDNITACTNVFPPNREDYELLSLPKVSTLVSSLGLETRLNSELFAGLIIKNPHCTAILYSTGGLVIVGAKTLATAYTLATLIDEQCATTLTLLKTL